MIFVYRRKIGFTLLELMACVSILIILMVIAIPFISGAIEKAKAAADMQTLSTLNLATSDYLVQNPFPDPFNDTGNSSEVLIQMLVSEGYLNKCVEVQQKDMSFYWDFTNKNWKIVELLMKEQLTLGSGGYTGYITGSDLDQASDILIPKTIDGVGITDIYQDAFSGSGLTSVSFPADSSLRRIHARAFKDNSLTEVTLPDSLQRLDYGAFMGNNITKVRIGDGVYLEGNVFQNNDKFRDAYTGAGTYFYRNGNWLKQ